MKSLAVDDVQVVQRIMSHILSRHGDCDVASNGLDALKLFVDAHYNSAPYDILFLDIMMPGMTGLELLRRIRQVDTGTDRVKIVMATAVSDHQTVAEAQRLGCDRYMVKPLRPFDVDRVLSSFELI